ncbi:protein orai-3 [Hydra vulgaris]|uniref:Protein orai-3 n=1 Tax=Hydra vulgaris TaxID=6087 RepID=A0ABM4CQ18_HYDVU
MSNPNFSYPFSAQDENEVTEAHVDNQLISWRKLLLSKAKLKASSRTSGLMSGFAMVAMVEITITEKDVIPPVLWVLFSILTTVLISVHVFALMISVCILPNIETIDELHGNTYAGQNGAPKTLPTDSPHLKLQMYIEVAWIFSTGLGTLLFLIEIPVLMWVKFYSTSPPAAIACTIIMVPVCIVFVIFAIVFYRKLIKHKYDRSSHEIEEMENLAKQLSKSNLTFSEGMK